MIIFVANKNFVLEIPGDPMWVCHPKVKNTEKMVYLFKLKTNFWVGFTILSELGGTKEAGDPERLLGALQGLVVGRQVGFGEGQFQVPRTVDQTGVFFTLENEKDRPVFVTLDQMWQMSASRCRLSIGLFHHQTLTTWICKTQFESRGRAFRLLRRWKCKLMRRFCYFWVLMRSPDAQLRLCELQGHHKVLDWFCRLFWVWGGN